MNCPKSTHLLACLMLGMTALSAHGEAPRAGLSDGHPTSEQFGQVQITFRDRPALTPSSAVCGFSLVTAANDGPQVAVTQRPATWLVNLRPGEAVDMAVRLPQTTGPYSVTAETVVRGGGQAEVSLILDSDSELDWNSDSNSDDSRVVLHEIAMEKKPTQLSIDATSKARQTAHFRTRATESETTVRWSALRLNVGDREYEIPLSLSANQPDHGPPPRLPPLRPAIERALVEWDWRMQDGIDTERVPGTYREAVAETLARGDRLIADLQTRDVLLGGRSASWQALKREFAELRAAETNEAVEPNDSSPWQDLWRRVHAARRELVLANPIVPKGPLLFVKQIPATFSHQLTQYYGRYARPGGGVFVLDAPGRSMACRRLGGEVIATGSHQHPEISHDGDRILFSYCDVRLAPTDRESNADRFFHLYDMARDGSDVRQLTDGAFDDFSPRYLPNGKILFVSTRRGGFHRCGRGPCPAYTLTLAESDGSNPRTVSYHETHEWDPAVLHDGRVIYTRWDYVDRHAVHYQQLWSVRPDGSDPRIFYGNNTFNPVGVWEARPVPDSRRVMATAAAHHAMTAGSIILLDITRGQDGLEPIQRLTPDAWFPESEAPVVRRSGKGGYWHAPVGVTGPPPTSQAARRWPGHCYRSPYPLAESYFLAAYSFDSLIGEPTGNPANMFGIYLVDRFGNKELLYRDLNLSSLWPMPLRSRERPDAIPSIAETPHLADTSNPTDASIRQPRHARLERFASAAPLHLATTGSARRTQSVLAVHSHAKREMQEPNEPKKPEGTYFLRDVHLSWPGLPEGAVRRLRILQLLPKSTPHKDDPMLGIPTASPGKQVLGTVPVEQDGSAYFRAPAGLPLTFQALDARNQAIQIMRSVTYLQPGEQAACVGCHERPTMTPPLGRMALALAREPSKIEPAPDGANPLSYPILVQPVLDEHCIACHNRKRPDGGVVLTGEPEERYTVSYRAMASRVPYSAWGGRSGDFRLINSEPTTQPDFFGARGSDMMKMLLDEHQDVKLGPDDIERLATWMDANVLFYGTFNPADQARQQRGERIEGPGLE